MTKIAVFGSAFNPPTFGHKSVIQRLSHFDKILLVPSISHAWGKKMLPFQVRVEMVSLFIDDLNQDGIELSTIENDIYIPDQKVTTFLLLNTLQDAFPNAEITFVIGPDNFLKFEKFSHSHKIIEHWSILSCPETLAIRSSDIRDAIKDGKEIHRFTTPKVVDYINHNKLY